MDGTNWFEKERKPTFLVYADTYELFRALETRAAPLPPAKTTQKKKKQRSDFEKNKDRKETNKTHLNSGN